MNDRTVASTRLTMSEVMTPNHANFLGNVFGGSILSMIDLAAYATASRFAGNIAVTASFDRVDFLEPINVGEVVTCEGEVSYVGRSSMEVTIQVYAEDVLQQTRRHTNTARVTMVAIRDGKPVEVPRLSCETREERVRYLEGKLRRELRKRWSDDLKRLSEKIRDLNDVELNRFIEAPDATAELLGWAQS